MESVQWFLITLLILEIPAAFISYLYSSSYTGLSFLWCWKINQLIPIGGGIYIGLIFYFR